MSRVARSALPLVGWREWVLLPELSTVPMKAKLDTGARTGALHAFGLELFERDGSQYVRFGLHPIQESSQSATVAEVAVVGFRTVRSSTGHAEERPVIRTPVTLGEHRYEVDLTLTSRDEMGFRLLIGRAALRGRFVVDPGRSFVASQALAREMKTEGGSRSPKGRSRP